jgi:electron-transferring-flavoprotein dehydrogenase
MTRESMPYDVLIVGAGPAGLAAAIRIKQHSPETTVCILEKGSEVGAHILSGAVIDPKALNELFPDWKARGAPMGVEVSENHHWVMSATGKTDFPHFFMPPMMNNQGCYTASLGNLCRWLGTQAEQLGVEIFPGFAGSEILYNDNGSVKGVATGDMGVAKDGSHKSGYQPGMEIHAKYSLFAEGVRGSLSKQLMQKYALRDGVQPQTYGIGLKELWDIDPAKHKPGMVIHTQGWPMANDYAGGFIYHQENNQVAIGYVVSLDYANPHISPFDEFQRYKTHPAIAKMLEGGRRVAYGARAINEGGLQSIPKLTFPGGALIGCSAGFLNVPRIKGSHGAMKSGMMAADAIVDKMKSQSQGGDEITAYADAFKASWLHEELRGVRNFRPLLAKLGMTLGTLAAGVDLWINNLGLGFLTPWTLGHHDDHSAIKRKDQMPRITYPKPDGKISFDKLSSVFLSNTNHEEDQPVHLRLTDPDVPVKINLPLYDEPAQRYCPAGVYEIVGAEDNAPRLQINAQNCVHCKTCDIKDPTQNITWVTPEGGGGPNYPNM